MDLNQLKSYWKKSKKLITESHHLNKMEMETIIKKQADKTTFGLSRVFIMAIVVQSATILIQLSNFVKYIHVYDFAIAIITSILLVILALYFTVNRYKKLNSVDYEVLSLAESLKQKIRFYKFSYNKWVLSFAFSFVIFLWSINILTGDFTSLSNLNLRIFFVYNFVLLFIFFTYRYAHTRYLKEYEICLNDLGGQQLTDLRTENIKFRRFKIILIIILILTLLLGIVVLFVS